MTTECYFVIDVESVGLHGESFAVGAVLIDRTGNELLAFKAVANLETAKGESDDLEWVVKNCPDAKGHSLLTKNEVLNQFWKLWEQISATHSGVKMFAECGWPVEANFLSACIKLDPRNRRWNGPYPLHDVATMMFAAGMDCMVTHDRLPNELPKHCPLADARQSGRLLIMALDRLQEKTRG